MIKASKAFCECSRFSASSHGEPLLALLVLTHARPHVGVEHFGSFGRLVRVADELDRPSRLHSGSPGGLDDAVVRVVTLGNCRDEAHSQLRRSRHERSAHVVSVTEVRDPNAREPAQALADRHQVGEDLARVGDVGQPVDDRHARVGGELLHILMRERADDDAVEIAREHVRRVLDRLAAAELKIVGAQVEPEAAELGDSNLERDARAGGRLLEDHPERTAGEQTVLLALALKLLQLVGEVEDELELVRRPRGDPDEVASLEIRGKLTHRAQS